MERHKGMSVFTKVVELGAFTAVAQQMPLSVQVCINDLTDYFDRVADIWREFRKG